jgi:hypothetical protein
MSGMMDSRYYSLHQTLIGIDKAKIPLIAHDGNKFIIPGGSDDQGIYLFIPALANFLNIPLDSAIVVFYFSWNLLALGLGILGCFLLFKPWLQRFISITALLLFSKIVFHHGYVYSFLASAVIATIPLFLYFIRTNKTSLGFGIFCIFAGAWLGASNILRGYAGMGPLIFIVSMLAYNFRDAIKKNIIVGLLILSGLLISTQYVNHLIEQRNDYLEINEPEFKKIASYPFWHSIYIGFGYLQNRFGIEYRDSVASEKVRDLSPNAKYQSKEYNDLLRNEVLKLIKNHPGFVIQTIAAKFGTILIILIIFCNFGLLAAFYYPKSNSIDNSFIFGSIFQTSFGFLVLPEIWYLFGFIAFAVLYGILSINEALDHGFIQDGRKSLNIAISPT